MGINMGSEKHKTSKASIHAGFIVFLGGSGEIRTHGDIPASVLFKSTALNHSATLPNSCPASPGLRRRFPQVAEILALRLCKSTPYGSMQRLSRPVHSTTLPRFLACFFHYGITAARIIARYNLLPLFRGFMALSVCPGRIQVRRSM